jgi:uncharacterized protein YndB with AHSA1/START domain
MPHEFEIRKEITVEATPEQVWEAISTSGGVDSWFMGHSDFEPREGGTATFEMFGETGTSTITAWEPARRLAYRSEPDEQGRFMAFEYLVEGRGGGSTLVRLVHSGVLGDDWSQEYDALQVGDFMYLQKLALYLKAFAGRSATWNMFLVGPQNPDGKRVFDAFAAAFGLDVTPVEGDRVRLAVPGLPDTAGTVEFLRLPEYLGVRTAEGMYALVHGFMDTVVVEYHAFGEVDRDATGTAWRDWLSTLA